jgi:hypothetical protein
LAEHSASAWAQRLEFGFGVLGAHCSSGGGGGSGRENGGADGLDFCGSKNAAKVEFKVRLKITGKSQELLLVRPYQEVHCTMPGKMSFRNFPFFSGTASWE